MLRASRDDDVAAKASGVRTVRERLIAFVLSAAIVGAGGGLYAEFLGSMTVDEFYLEMTFVTLAMLVVGGIGSLSGAVVGVVVVTFVVEFLRTLEHGISVGPTTFALPSGSQEIGLGVVMALILILRPTGLTGGREFLEWHGDSAASQLALADRAVRAVEVSGVTQIEQHKSEPEGCERADLGIISGFEFRGWKGGEAYGDEPRGGDRSRSRDGGRKEDSGGWRFSRARARTGEIIRGARLERRCDPA